MGFLNPAGLVFGTLYAVLIALYLWERYRRREDVPSLLLWMAVEEDVIRSSRVRPDLLFWLQLILLSLLIGGLAQPYFTGGGGSEQPTRRIFVLDTSASMQAREGDGTRFDKARAALRRRLEALGPTDEAMLMTAADRPAVLVPFSRDHDAVAARLDEVGPVDTGTNLNLAAAIADSAAARTDLPTSIELFTDLPPTAIDPRWRAHVRVFQFGQTDDNLGIESVQVFQGRFQDHREGQADVVVRNFSRRETHGFLTLRLEDQVISRQGFSLAPRDRRAFRVRSFPQPGILQAHLEVDDALAVDNDAYEWVRPARPLRVLVISRARPLEAELKQIARATPNLTFRVLAPAEYRAADALTADVVVFHHFIPDAEPNEPALFLDPPADDPRLPARGEAADVDILDWNDRHPALSGLRPLAPFPIAHATVFDVPPWAEELLSARTAEREFAIAFAGEHDGHRRAYVSFDPTAERLLSADNVTWLLFFLNVIDWLAPADTSVAVVRTGQAQVLTHLPPLPRRITDPHGTSWTQPPNGALVVDARYAGSYRVQLDGTQRRILANFLDPAESDIGRTVAPSSTAPAERSGSARGPGARNHFGTWLYALAAIFLVLEWIVAMRRA